MRGEDADVQRGPWLAWDPAGPWCPWAQSPSRCPDLASLFLALLLLPASRTALQLPSLGWMTSVGRVASLYPVVIVGKVSVAPSPAFALHRLSTWTLFPAVPRSPVFFRLASVTIHRVPKCWWWGSPSQKMPGKTAPAVSHEMHFTETSGFG